MDFDIRDNFLSTFDELRAYADTAHFEDIQNEADDVVYPLICKEIPGNVVEEIVSIIKPNNFLMFMRLSPKGVDCPHQSHNDSSMGSKSLMLYVSRAEDCQGGTSLLQHKTGFSYPTSEEELNLATQDQNDSEQWDIVDLCAMKPNRAALFPAHLSHRAEPIGGFGDNQLNGRLVLTCFYD